MASTNPIPDPLQEVYAVFCGEVNAANTSKFVTNLTAVSLGGKVSKIHLLFQSWGGFVGDGIFVYNLLRNFPLDVVVYNSGHVASAGVTAFLGARLRKSTKTALFMIHKSSNTSATGAGVDRLKAIAESLVLEDARTETVLRENLRLPDELWQQHSYHDVYLTGEDALKYGLVDEIADFAPPPGSKVFSAIGG